MKYLLKNKFLLFSTILISIVGYILSVFELYLLGWLIQSIAEGNDELRNTYAILFAINLVIAPSLLFLSSVLKNRSVNDAVLHLRNETSQKLKHLKISKTEDNKQIQALRF